jgi:hypothetical protein
MGSHVTVEHKVQHVLCRCFPEKFKVVSGGHPICKVMLYSGKYGMYKGKDIV